MSDLFVDTSGWATWISPREHHHAAAAAVIRQRILAGYAIVTTSYILAELTALFARLRVPREKQIETLSVLRTDTGVLCISIEPDFVNEAWQLWESRPDKDWTLTDCASFVVMTHRGLTEALTTDRHFEQAGFARLLV